MSFFALERFLVAAWAGSLLVVCVAARVDAAQSCGDVDNSGSVSASDALVLLKKAVGQSVTVTCPPCASLDAAALAPALCGDLDASGSIAASDALLLLKKAVGQNVDVACPACTTTTTTGGVTTTTLGGPAGCGNGVVDGDEQCEQLQGCADGERCTADCTCEAIPAEPPSSQDLIEQALENGDIDYPTSLLYRVWALFQAPELPEQFDGAGTAGEDTGLFFELSHARSTLPAEIETAIAPYLVRPNDPASIYSQDPGTTSLLALEDAADPPPIGCPPNAQGQADWRYTESAGNHFVVWSCGGGVNGTDPYAAGRATTASLAEEIWDQFKEMFKVPAPDDFAAGPAPQNRTDIYLLVPNQCRKRGDSCVVIPGKALAAASPATPCSAQDGGGPLTSSSYLLVKAAMLGDTTELRYILTHEMFHAASFAVNLGAQGAICPNGTPSLLPKTQRSWLTEASAEWSSFALYPEDKQDRRLGFFQAFQKRNPATEGLQNVTIDVLPYEAFLYPAFVQEEASQDPQYFFDFWLSSRGARTRADLDRHLNRSFSFADHFRDFAVRNLNRELPGDPIFPLHESFDPALARDEQPFIPEPPWRLPAPLKVDAAVEIAPLFAQYEHYLIADEVQWGRFDSSNVANVGHLRIDAIIKVGETWKRREVDGPVFTFCRDKPEDDISELYLVYSNDDFDPEGKVSGPNKLETRTACPGGWSGTISWVQTLDSHQEDVEPHFTEIFDRHVREEQRWTITGSEVVTLPGGGAEAEKLDAAWSGRREHLAVTTSIADDCTAVTTETGSGNGSASSAFYASSFGGGVFSIQPTESDPSSFELPIEYVVTNCDGGSSFLGGGTFYEGRGYIVATPMTYMQEDPPGSGQFSGSYTVLHSEQALPGGQEVIDLTVEWSLTRTPGP